MFEPIGDTRKLPYPLYNQETNGNITDDLGLVPNDFVWPTDPEERTVVPFLFSQREFTAIASAVDVGADIAYPEQYIAVWWLLVRSLRYRVPICELIIPCIESDTDVQQALADAIIASPSIGAAIVQMLEDNDTFNTFLKQTITGLTTGQIVNPIIAGDCDPAVLMGKVKALVDRMNKTNTDFLEIVEVGTNDEEKLAALVELIPGLNQEPVADVIDFLQDVLEDFEENYAAAITEERLLEMYCGLYCVAEGNENCELNYEDVFDFFSDRASSGLTLSSLLGDIIQFVITGDFATDDLIVNGMFAMQAALVRVGGELAGMSLPSIALATRDALPSTLWEECEECPPDCVPGSNCGNPAIGLSRGVIICEDASVVDVELTPLDGNYTCYVVFTATGDCRFNGWLALEGTFTAWPQFAPYTQGVRFIGDDPSVDSGDPDLTGFLPDIIQFFSTTPCTIRMQVS